MPNHFTVVALCGRDYDKLESRGLEDYDEIDLSPLKGANLCSLLAPLPEELGNIVASISPCRYRHKTTGAWNDDVNAPMDDRDQWEQVTLDVGERNQLISKYGYDNWFDWQANNWGTKWGTYDLDFRVLGGDGSPLLIEFQTAWGPPTPEMMRRIDDYLCETYCLKSIKWMGHNPYDNETCDIEVAPATTPSEATGA